MNASFGVEVTVTVLGLPLLYVSDRSAFRVVKVCCGPKYQAYPALKLCVPVTYEMAVPTRYAVASVRWSWPLDTHLRQPAGYAHNGLMLFAESASGRLLIVT